MNAKYVNIEMKISQPLQLHSEYLVNILCYNILAVVPHFILQNTPFRYRGNQKFPTTFRARSEHQLLLSFLALWNYKYCDLISVDLISR